MDDSFRNEILKYAFEKYGTEPEYLWEKYPDFAVLRHRSNKKWYGVIMNVPGKKLGLESNDETDILNIKCGEMMTGSLLMNKGMIPAYHMNKKHWVSILLNGTVEKSEVFSLLDMSYEITANRSAK